MNRARSALFAAALLAASPCANAAGSFFSGEIQRLLQHGANGESANPRYSLAGRIVYVDDGDTVVLLTGDQVQHHIRLANIDAPEVKHGAGRPGQSYGQTAKKALAALIAGTTLTAACYEQDRYGRDVCLLPYGETTANQEMVRQGFAWAFTGDGGKYLRDATLIALQQSAAARRLGLWQGEKPVPPWDWRVACWSDRHCEGEGQ